MKALGIVRKIDDLGRVVIPKEIRNAQGWQSGTPLEMFATEDGIFMQQYGRQQEARDVVQKLHAADELVTSESAKLAIQQAIEFINRK